MTDTSLNLLTLSLAANAPGMGADSLLAAAAQNMAANSNTQGAFQQFDTLLTQAQQQDTQQSGSQGGGQNSGGDQASVNGQNNASSAPASTQSTQQNSGQQQADNAEQDNTQASSDGTQNTSNTSAGKGKEKDKSSSSDAAAGAAAGVFTFAQPQASAAGSAANDQNVAQSGLPSQSSLLSALEALLAQLEQSAPVSQPSGTGQTDAPAGDAFQQLMQSLQQAGGTTGNTSVTSLLSSLQGALQAGAQNLSPADVQQLSALVAQLAAGADAAQTGATQQSPLPDALTQVATLSANTTPAAPPAPTQNTSHAALQPLLKPADAPANTNTSAANTSSTDSTSTASTPLGGLTSVSTSGSNTDSSGQGSGSTGQDGQPHSALLPASPLMVQPPGVGGANSQAPFTQVLDQTQQPQQSSPVEQLVATVKAAAQNGESKIQIQLHPAELGWLDIHLEVTPEGHASMSVTADNPATLKMLSGDVKVLQQMLSDIGLKADAGSLSFNLRGDGQQGQQGQNQNQGNGQGYSGYRASAPTALDDAFSQATPQTYVMSAADGVDIRI